MFSQGAKKIASHKVYLNKINFFPVPDADTGTNMQKTVIHLSHDHVSLIRSSIASTGQAIADGVIMAAKGNSGAILAQFFQGFAEGLQEQESITLKQFAQAAYTASVNARKAVVEPIEGTILTVMKDWATYLNNNLKKEKNFITHLHKAQKVAEKSLKNTMKTLQVLKNAHQVDAGAQGFVYLVQGIVEYLTKKNAIESVEYPKEMMQFQDFFDMDASHYQFCTEVMITGKDIPIQTIKDTLSNMGDSLIVIGSPSKVKVHIHTNEPGNVFQYLHQYGTILQEKVDDMKQQVKDIADAKSNRICVVVDSTCTLSKELMEKYNIHVLPLRVRMDGIDHLDGYTIQPENILEHMKETNQLPTTSQVTISDAERMFQWTSQLYDHTICITISKVDSGTYQSVETAAQRVNPDKITVIDSLSGAGGLALIAVKAAEMIRQKKDIAEITKRLLADTKKLQIYVTVDNLSYLYRGGRLSKTKFILGNILKLIPIIATDPTGKLYKKKYCFGGKKAAFSQYVSEVVKKTRKLKKVHYIISHTHEEEKAQFVKGILELKCSPVSISLAPMSSVLSVHGGPGTFTVAWIDDP